MKAIKENWKMVLIVAAGIIAVIFMCIFGIQGAQNKAFAMEEQVNTADSDIKVQEKKGDDTIKESSHVRHKYYGVDTEYIGTIFTELRDKTISDNSSFYENSTIEETVDYLESDWELWLFWVIWIIVIGLCVFGFYYIDNEWIEN